MLVEDGFIHFTEDADANRILSAHLAAGRVLMEAVAVGMMNVPAAPFVQTFMTHRMTDTTIRMLATRDLSEPTEKPRRRRTRSQ